MRDVEWITFDCYGTLIDWERGICGYFDSLLAKKAMSGEPRDILEAWEPIQFQMIQRPWQPYRQILFQSLYEAFLRLHIPWKPSDSIGFGVSMESWRPFTETREALRRLKKKFRLAILSNIDDSIIEKTLVLLEVPFDLVVTAEQVQSYKPHAKHFEVGLKRMSVAPARVLHAAFGFEYDIGPAKELGYRTCYVNRRKLPPPAPTDLVVEDLAELATKLGS